MLVPWRGAWLVAATVAVVGCSENVGPPPPDGGARIEVRVERPTGPRSARSGSVLAVRGGVIWLGTDAGLLRVRAEATEDLWLPAHAGFFGANGSEAPGRLTGLAVSSDAERIVFTGRRSTSATIGVSDDAGASFVGIERPDVLDFEVDAVGIAPPSPRWPGGAWLVAQGRRVFSRDVGTATWVDVELPGEVLSIGAVAADAAGRLVVGAQVDSDSSAVFVATAEDFTARGRRAGAEVLDLVATEEAVLWVTATGVHRDDVTFVSWPGRVLTAASVDSGGRWAVAVDADLPGAALVAHGTTPAVVNDADAVRLDDGVEALARHGSAVWATDAAAALTRIDGGAQTTPFAGTEAWLSAVGVIDAAQGRIAVARQLNGEVLVGPADDPDAFVSRGAQSTSTVQSIVVDPDETGTVLAGSFGVYASAASQQIWNPRNLGFEPYEIFLVDRITVVALESLGDGQLWSGGENGEGPYRWVPDLGRWERVHDGLGTPRSSAFGGSEPGLPYVTQVRDFARDTDGDVWMAGFRGGAWRLEGSTWRGENVGLPDLEGAPMDTCCVVAPARQVDVRAVERVAGGRLLAATAWGVASRARGDSRWQDRSLGLSNRDVRALAVSPRDPDTVVAVSRGSAGAPDWLFLSEDAGRTWFPVATSLVAVPAVDVVWSRPDRNEIVVLVEARGAWRLELQP